MAISAVQQGRIAEMEFAKLLMIGSRGRIEVAAPLSDDERRDYEIHVRGQYGFALAMQIKSVRRIYRARTTAHYLDCRFPVRATRLLSNPYYWYFVAGMDLKLMRFADPVFLVPSLDFHRLAGPVRRGDLVYLHMSARMEPATRDHWVPYRLDPLDLGKRVLEIMNDLRKHRSHGLELPKIWTPPGALLVWRAA